jgi:hypothetical protein
MNKKYRLHSFLLKMGGLALFAGQYLLIEKTVGGLSIKAISLLIAIAILALAVLTSSDVYARWQKNILLMWLGFMTYAVGAQLLNESMRSTTDVVDFAARYGAAWIVMAIGFLISNKKGGREFLNRTLFICAAVNFLFILLQVTGVQIAYDIHDTIYPESFKLIQEANDAGEMFGRGYASGLMPYSIGAAYVTGCFGITGIGLALSTTGAARSAMFVFTTIIVIGGGVLTVSRSTLYGGTVVIVLGLILAARNRSSWLALLTIAPVILLILPLLTQIQNIERLINLDDSFRSYLREVAIAEISASPLVGVNTSALNNDLSYLGAHNMLLNSALYFGVIGMILQSWFNIYTIVMPVFAKKKRVGNTVSAHQIGALAGMIVYTIKGLVHNESIATSGIMYAWLVAIAIPGKQNIWKTGKQRQVSIHDATD